MEYHCSWKVSPNILPSTVIDALPYNKATERVKGCRSAVGCCISHLRTLVKSHLLHEVVSPCGPAFGVGHGEDEIIGQPAILPSAERVDLARVCVVLGIVPQHLVPLPLQVGGLKLRSRNWCVRLQQKRRAREQASERSM